MTDKELDALLELSKKVTPGPWEVVNKGSHLYVTDSNPNREIAKITRIPKASAENAAYIVSSCNAVPSLIEENLALREQMNKLEQQRDWLADKLACMCSVSDCGSCGVPVPCPYSKGLLTRCWDAEKDEWILSAQEEACESV